MIIEFDNQEEKKQFSSALTYGAHGIAGLSVALGKVYRIIDKRTHEKAEINSREALNYIDDLLKSIGEEGVT